MSSVKVIDVVRRVEDILQDQGVRWPRLELQNWLNEAYLAITAIRPDATAVAGTLDCVAGTRQTLTTQFPTSLRLLDVTRNLASGSSKRVVRAVNRVILDDQRPGWHDEPETQNIQHYTFDPRQPKSFFVYPPAADTAQLEVVYADTPGTHSLSETDLDPEGSNSELILLDDIYLPPIIDWILYRAYSKDAEYGANEARAAASLQTFNAGVGAKSEADTASGPANNSTVT